MFIGRKGEPAYIPVEQIKANPNQPRKIFQDEELEELCDSIREFGIIQPLILKKLDKDEYELIAGERRLRAALRAGLKTVPAVIREADNQQSALIALIENVQRENLSFIEEAKAYKKLIDEHGLTQTVIAKKMGKRQSTISNKLRLLSLPEDIQSMITENHLTERHARALLKITDDELRKHVIERIIRNGLNVTQSEKLINDVIARSEEAARSRCSRLSFINYKIYINTIKNAFKTINEVEHNARFFQEDREDMVELRILIPKKSSSRGSANIV